MKPTKRMLKAIDDTKYQMRANSEHAALHFANGMHDRDAGNLTGALRSFSQAAGDYGMACAYAISLGNLYGGLGPAFEAEQDAMATLQGQYAMAGDTAEQQVSDLLSGPVYRRLAAVPA